MSAETLREAAAAIRADYSDRSEAKFENAVADLLDTEAAMCEDFAIDEDETPEALAVARAYLEECA